MINNFEFSKWKFFSLKDIFDSNLKIKKYQSEPEAKGTIPYITSSSINNGVSAWVDEIPSFSKESLTISTNGQCFDAFLQLNIPFCISTDVEILYNKNFNTKHYLFIATILKLEQYRWSYGRKPKNGKVFNTKIKLPVLDNGQIDLLYMESYIDSLFKRERENHKLDHRSKVNTSYDLKLKTWQSFKIGGENGIFKVFRSKNVIAEDASNYLGDEIPYVTRTENNNGIDFFINTNSDFKLEEGNCITIGGEGANSFYQPYNFISGNNIAKLYSPFLNEKNALFIVTLLKLEKFRYSYNRAFNRHLIENTHLFLPSKNGQPDWEFMTNFIKDRENNELIRLNKILNS